MKCLKLLPLFMLGASLLAGQGLEVRYYVQSDSIVYLQDGNPTKKPRLRSGQMATLRIIDYNNYLYQATVTAKAEKSVSTPASVDFTSLVPGMPDGSASPLSAVMNLFNFPKGQLEPGGFPEDTKSSGFGSASMEKINSLAQQFNASTAYIKVLEQDIQAKGASIQQSLESQRVGSIAADEIKKLKRNPSIPPRKIKSLSKEYLGTVLGDSQAEGLTLSEVLRKADASQELSQSLDHYKKITDTLSQQLEIVSGIQSSLEALEVDSAFIKPIAAYYQSGSKRLSDYQRAETLAREKLPEVKNLGVPSLLALRYELEELDANNFTYTYRTAASGDALTLNMSLQPVDSAATLGAKPRELPSLQIPVYGGFRVNASVGISFGSFFERQQAFYVRDSTIVAEDQDKFLPIITSFVHFYPQSAGNISVGGAFGLGFPLGGEAKTQSVSFFFGPSIILGKSERITINLGLMGGKAKRLSQGYSVGSHYVYTAGTTIGSDVEAVPTRLGYEFGYYMGFSFNLLSGK